MYQKVDDFLNVWKNEASLTLKVMEQLTDESLKQEAAPDHWSIGKLAWHLVTTIGFLSNHIGLKVEGPAGDAPIPTSAKEIADSYRKTSEAFVQAIETQLNDEEMSSTIDFLGGQTTKGFALSLIVNHQIHHRGQMTILMRQAGVRVPGIYGPTKEEWAEMSSK